jgi:hypothetical protein
MLLDIVEVPRSHTGENLAIAFAKVLELFGIKDKVRRVSDLNTKGTDTYLSYLEQILSLTTDNASNNDTMVHHLAELLNNFPGPANQTRCFAHTLSISAKAVIKQFDVPKANTGEALDEAVSALIDIELEDRVEQEAWVEDDDDEGEDQPLNAWEDFREGLSDEQRRELDIGVQPVRSTLVKVC